MPLLPFITALGALLVAGVFLAFSSFVMAALGRLPPAQGIAAMQAINVTAVNPVFMAILFGTALLAAWLAAQGFLHRHEPGQALRGLGGALYVIGVTGVTMARNVPLNNALAAAGPADAALWADYLGGWTLWNHVRGLAAFASGVVILLAR